MRRHLVLPWAPAPRRNLFPAAALAVAALLASSACNCGKPIVTNTTSSIALEGDTLDFGIVAEGTSKGGKFRVNNNGRAPVNVGVVIGAGSSADFTLGTVPTSVEAGGFIEVPVVFTPIGPGSDEGTAEVLEMGGMTPLIVHLKGGPIEPFLDVLPDPVDFRPSTMAQETRMVQLKSVGTSALTINAVGVSATGNPDFSVDGPTMPTRLLPGEFVTARVVYQRSMNIMNGYMEVLSDDSDAGLRRVPLIPDRPTACSDTLDNDMDGLIDFPNDPGCQTPQDDDEYNPAQCVNGATRMCGSMDGGSLCSGMQSCINGLWSMCNGAGMPMTETCNNIDDDCNGVVDNGVTRACWTGDAGQRGIGNCRDGMELCSQGMFIPNCMGQVLPGTEVCGNGIDENCNGMADEGCAVDAGCNANGIFTLDAGSISYSCCDYLGSGFLAVDFDITRFQIQTNATQVRPQTNFSGGLLPATMAATCPNGTFSYTKTITGQCDETYTLTGTFVGPNTFVGTFSASFSGPQCQGAICNNVDCVDQTWNISAGR